MSASIDEVIVLTSFLKKENRQKEKRSSVSGRASGLKLSFSFFYFLFSTSGGSTKKGKGDFLGGEVGIPFSLQLSACCGPDCRRSLGAFSLVLRSLSSGTPSSPSR